MMNVNRIPRVLEHAMLLDPCLPVPVFVVFPAILNVPLGLLVSGWVSWIPMGFYKVLMSLTLWFRGLILSLTILPGGLAVQVDNQCHGKRIGHFRGRWRAVRQCPGGE